LRSVFGKRLGESLGFDPTVDFREPNVHPLEFDQGELIQLFIPPQIQPKPGDYFIRKHTYNGFFETRLDSRCETWYRNCYCRIFKMFRLVHRQMLFSGYKPSWYAMEPWQQSLTM
jgi:hypothetical protein